MGLAVLFLSSVNMPSARAGVTGVTTRLTTGSANSTQTWPMISGTDVVWTNAGTDFDVYWMDIATTNPAINLTNTPSEQEYLEDIDGTDVVFTRTSTTSSGDIVVYDTTTGYSNTVAASIGPIHYEQPAIRGRYIVYVRSSTQSDIDGYDNATGLAFDSLVTNDAALQAKPRVAGDYIVWEDYRNGSADIYGYQISTSGPAFAIATGASGQTSPDIDGNRVVWIDDASGSDQIWSYDLTTKISTQLTRAASNKVQPRISGTRVVWADDRAGNLDIYSYDFTASTEDVIVSGAGDQMLSDIDGNRVVYTSNDSGFESVYLFTISAPPPPDPLPVGCDPAKTTIVGSFTLDRTGSSRGRSSYGFGWYAAQPGATYYICVENGKPDGSARTSNLVAVDDFQLVISPIDLRPSMNPPHWVAKQVTSRRSWSWWGNFHYYSAALFGRDRAAAHATVSLRKLK